MNVLVLLGSLGVFVLPGWPLAKILFANADRVERWLWSVTLGLACSIYLAFCSLYVGLAYFPVLWGIAFVVLVAWARLSARPATGATLWRPEHWQLALVLLLVAATRFWVAVHHELPPGWDPSFHLVLARKIFESGRMITDWKPFEDVSLNYPVGSHVLVATLARFTGLPLHTVFNYLIPTLGVLTTAQLYLFVKGVTRNGAVAVYGALAYGLWANMGSIDYYRWGGLPNLLGMILLLALLTVVARPPHVRWLIPTCSLIYASVIFVHHHVAVTGLVILTSLCAWFGRTERTRPRATLIVLSVGGGIVLGSFYILPYVLKVVELDRTGVMRYSELFFGFHELIASLGILLYPGLLGLVLLACRKAGCRFDAVFWGSAITLVALFAVCEYAYRLYALHYLGGNFVAFTPSRFLTDLIYFWCVFAGLGFAAAERWLLRARAGWGVGSLPFALALLLGVSNLWLFVWLRNVAADVDDGLVRGFRWVDLHTASDTIVLNSEPWATYLTWRRCAATPLPVSEPSPPGTSKNVLLADLMSGRRPAGARSAAVVEVGRGRSDRRTKLLWRDPSGVEVRQVLFEDDASGR